MGTVHIVLRICQAVNAAAAMVSKEKSLTRGPLRIRSVYGSVYDPYTAPYTDPYVPYESKSSESGRRLDHFTLELDVRRRVEEKDQR